MDQPRETMERKGRGYSWAEDDDHARVLLALHLELLAYGLNVHHGGNSPAVRIEQSSAGAFPPMRYVDGGEGRVITIHALAMFDDLIVSGTAVATAGGDGGRDSSGDAVHRRTTFSVSEWSPQLLISSTSRHQQQQSGGVAKGQPRQQEQLKEGQQQNAEESPSGGAQSDKQCPAATKHPHLPERQAPPPGDGDKDGRETGKGTLESTSQQQQQQQQQRRRQRRPSLAGGGGEAFRSRVVSGLLLHLCPPPGHFADLLGCGDELLRHVLGMLGARDLATVGLVRKGGLFESCMP
ncbi:unnamed protein product [Ectocarpus sp. 12 AP-2014]